MPDAPKTWSNTELWKQLMERKERADNGSKAHEAAAKIVSQLELWMKKIEAVLSKGHTDPLDFTMHDDEHSFRVAEGMLKLVKREHWEDLSDYEIALLLLAAYLHDIGMSPERKKVGAIYRHLLIGEKSEFMEGVAADLQRWLDENHHDLDLSQPRPPITSEYLDHVEEITTFYVRYKHNDWSAGWIRENLSGELHLISDWQDVLIRLCQSHHEAHAVLRGDQFNARAVGGTSPQRLHLRHLACVLRIADILENSPDRVPRIIFQHRNIVSRPKSIVHWAIPHQLDIYINAGTVHVSAEPLEARFDKAIRTLVADIDKELAGCAAIAKDSLFKQNRVLGDSAREWPLEAACMPSINPHNNAYEYIEGAFRPNTAKLLELLSGKQIYATPLAAVRELLQNGFDAVREKIARKRLKLTHPDSPSDPKWEVDFGADEHVTLTFSRDPDGILLLSCQDSGCGMTKEIIRDHLLVSGDGRRPALIDLERKCKTAGFSLNRTGQFGIGVLSYFMMAAEVRITTCRDQLCRDEISNGWTFFTTGVGDFGELRKLTTQPPAGPGTVVEWRLDKTKYSDAEKLYEELEKYLRETLIRVPCNFRFLTVLAGKPSVSLDFSIGWTHKPEDVRAVTAEAWAKKEQAGAQITYNDSTDLIAGKLAISERLPKWNEDALKRMRFLERTFPLPGACGFMRVVLPWFELSEGRSLVYVLRDNEQEGRLFLSGEGIRPDPKIIMSWKGMASNVQGAEKPKPGTPAITLGGEYVMGWITFDLYNIPADQLQVNRASFLIPNALLNSFRELAMATLAGMVDEVMKETQQPPHFGILSNVLLNRPLVLEQGPAWAIAAKEQSVFAPLRLPCVYTGTGLTLKFGLKWRNVPVPDVLMIGIGNAFHDRFHRELRPQRIVAVNHAKDGTSGLETPAGIWDSTLTKSNEENLVPFPPEWVDVWGCGWVHNRRVLNPKHWAIQLLNTDQRKELQTIVAHQPITPAMVEQIIDPLSALLFLLHASIRFHPHTWALMRKNFPQVLELAWKLCSELTGGNIALFPLIVFNGNGWHHFTPANLQRHELTNPTRAHFIPQVEDNEWRLTPV